MNIFRHTCVLGLVVMCAQWLVSDIAVAQAATKQPDAATLERVQKMLQSRIPNIPIVKVQPSQWPWLYEVVTDGELFYVDTSGDYLFYGKVLDTRSRTDLTEARWNEINKVDMQSLPLNLAMKLVKGDGSRKLVVFADPDCPYCVRLEKTLQDVTNITVYTFLFPLESLHPEATERARKIWCAPNRQATWMAWINNKTPPPPAKSDCDTSGFSTVLALGDKMKVNGTPTLLFENGRRIPGALDKARMEQELALATKAN